MSKIPAAKYTQVDSPRTLLGTSLRSGRSRRSCAILRELNRRPLICAPSNAAVDTVMEKVMDHAPELKPIRFHSVNIELLAIKREAGNAQRSRNTRNYSRLATRNGDKSMDKSCLSGALLFVDTANPQQQGKWLQHQLRV